MAETKKVKHPSVEERAAKGKGCREKTPVSSHTGWVPAPDRPDPVALLEEQNLTREQDLVPVRHGRMLVSPFTFYRGAAKIMATDLKDTPPGRPRVPTVRGRPSVQLRRLRLTRANPAVRSQRFRRNSSRPLRVRRQTHGRELHHRGAEQRVHQGRNARRDTHRGSGVPRGDGRVRTDGHPGHLVRPSVRGTADGNH